MKIKIELIKSPDIKKINFLTSLLGNYENKKILYPVLHKLLNDEEIIIDVDYEEFKKLIKFENYLHIESAE